MRLDTTTNWAIGVSVAVTTFALGNAQAPSVILLLPFVLCAVFLFVESRRFQELELFRERVRLIERAYLAPALRGSAPAPDWAGELARSLEAPHAGVSLRMALANRVRRNYLWLFLALHGAWWVKLWLVDHRIVAAAALGPLDGRVVIALSVAMLVPLLLLARQPSEVDIA